MSDHQAIKAPHPISHSGGAAVRPSVFSQHRIWHEIEESHKNMHVFDESILKREVESPSLAKSYTQAIVHGWLTLQRKGVLDYAQPCYLLELDSNSGEFSALILAQLKSVLTPEQWRQFNPHYILSDSRPEKVSDCWQHPALRQWIEQGHLEPVEYDARHQRFINLKSRRLILGRNSFVNPVVVMANGVFSSMRQSLYHIHYGKCFSAELTHIESDEAAGENHQAANTFQYHWNEVDVSTANETLLKRYLHRLDSAVVLIPDQAFESIQRLSELAANGLLLLSSDRGFYGEPRLREQAMPEMGPLARYFLPLNGHALSWYIESLGGNVSHVQSAGDQALTSLIWCPSRQIGAQAETCNNAHHEQATGTDSEPNRDVSIQTQDLSVLFTPGHHHMALKAAELAHQGRDSLTAGQLLELLRFSQFDHTLLFSHMDCVFESLPRFDALERLNWRDAVSNVWQQYYAFQQDHESLVDFALLAMRLGMWGASKRCLQYLVEQRPNSLIARYYLVVCMMQLGDRDAANREIHVCLRQAPDDQSVLRVSDQLNHWAEQCQHNTAYAPELGRDQELSLQPLADHYAEEFLYQYRDPSIAVMTSLPDMTTPEEFEQWREQQASTANQSAYAVIHKEFGFVGVVSLRWHGENGFFYFWIGTDYQGQGYGQRAAQLLFSMATQTLGLNNVYTCAFADNLRSSKALKILGFTSLPIKAHEPDQDYVFYALKPIASEFARLSALLKGIESPIRLVNKSQ